MPIAALWQAWSRRLSNLPAPLPPAGEPASVAFPSTDLVFRVQVALGADLSADWRTWGWEDITSYVRLADGITRTWGRRDRTSKVQSSRVGLTLDNNDGRFARLNPSSPYYGLLTRNTPIWIEVNPGSGFVTWWQGYVNSWPLRWPSLAATDLVAPITCSGTLRRLVRDNDPPSALRRTLTAAGPALYWPAEDGASSVAIAAVAGGTDLTLHSARASTLSAVGGLAGSESLPEFVGDSSIGWGGAFALATVEPRSDPTAWTVEFWARIAPSSTPSISDQFYLAKWSTTSRQQNWSIVAEYASASVTASCDEALMLTVGPSFDAFDSAWHHYRYIAAESGSAITVSLYIDDILQATTTDAGPYTGGVGSIRSYRIEPGTLAAGDGGSCSIGHVAIFDSATSTSGYAAGLGHAGEQAHARFGRLCVEAGIPYTAGASDSAEMGPQPTTTLMALYDEITDVDGVVYESGFGLAHLSNSERWNAPVVLTVDYASGHERVPPVGDDDDATLVNRYTASRPSGGSYTYEETSGRAGTGAGGVGLYPSGGTVNVETDAQLADQAAWRVRQGTADEYRWSRLDLDLRHSPELIPAAATLGYGAHVALVNMPTPLPAETIHLVVEGGSDRISPKMWEVGLFTSPFAPFDVRRLAADTGDTDGVGWWSPDTFTLAVGVSSSDASWQVTCDPVLSTDADDYPCDVYIGGELVTITAVSGASAPQTATVTRSVNGVSKVHAANAEIELAHPLVYIYGSTE